MKRTYIIVGILFAILAIIIVWLLMHGSESPPLATQDNAADGGNLNSVAQPVLSQKATSAGDKTQPTGPVMPSEERQKLREQAIDRANDEWRAPIDFYGKVVDQDNNPVPEATVVLSWNNLSGTHNGKAQSDSEGLFSLREEQGKFLSVIVNKEGYYAYKPQGEGFFYAGRNDNFMPDQGSPVIFQLRKKGHAEPLIAFENDFLIPKDGKPVEVSLTRGRPAPSGQGDLRVECWTSDQGKGRGEKYDWKCRIAIPNGGLQPASGGFAFEAPVDGYQPFDEIDMRVNLGAGWQRNAERNYFLKLGNGNYARISFKMIAGGGHFFHVESFLNPRGSRNLEYDEAVQPKPTVHE